MKTFILIVYFYTLSSGGGMTLSTAEFNSKAACENARIELKTLQGPSTWAKTICVSKGE